MNKNLVITISGDSSTHSQFLTTDRNFDLFVVYYGDKYNAYESDGDYYERLKGTKFNIVLSWIRILFEDTNMFLCQMMIL